MEKLTSTASSYSTDPFDDVEVTTLLCSVASSGTWSDGVVVLTDGIDKTTTTTAARLGL